MPKVKVHDYMVVSLKDQNLEELFDHYNEAVKAAKEYSKKDPSDVVTIHRWLESEEYDSEIDDHWEKEYVNGKLKGGDRAC